MNDLSTANTPDSDATGASIKIAIETFDADQIRALMASEHEAISLEHVLLPLCDQLVKGWLLSEEASEAIADQVPVMLDLIIPKARVQEVGLHLAGNLIIGKHAGARSWLQTHRIPIQHHCAWILSNQYAQNMATLDLFDATAWTPANDQIRRKLSTHMVACAFFRGERSATIAQVMAAYRIQTREEVVEGVFRFLYRYSGFATLHCPTPDALEWLSHWCSGKDLMDRARAHNLSQDSIDLLIAPFITRMDAHRAFTELDSQTPSARRGQRVGARL